MRPLYLLAFVSLSSAAPAAAQNYTYGTETELAGVRRVKVACGVDVKACQKIAVEVQKAGIEVTDTAAVQVLFVRAETPPTGQVAVPWPQAGVVTTLPTGAGERARGLVVRDIAPDTVRFLLAEDIQTMRGGAPGRFVKKFLKAWRKANPAQ